MASQVLGFLPAVTGHDFVGWKGLRAADSHGFMTFYPIGQRGIAAMLPATLDLLGWEKRNLVSIAHRDNLRGNAGVGQVKPQIW